MSPDNIFDLTMQCCYRLSLSFDNSHRCQKSFIGLN